MPPGLINLDADNDRIKKIIRAYNIEPPLKFWIGDVVYFTPTSKNYVIDKYGYQHWDTAADYYINSNDSKSQSLKIDGITKFRADSDSLWWFSCRAEDNNGFWISQEALVSSKPEIPSYKPRKIEKTLEAQNNIKDAEEITILIRNIDEWDIIEKTLNEYGYVVRDSFRKLVNSTNDPINIFIHLKSGIITQTTLADRGDWTKHSTFNGVWERELTIENLPLIKRILKTGMIIGDIPSYEPRRIIKKIDEKMNLPGYMPDIPPILTPEEQRKLYIKGDIVVVRPDAFDYFNDVDEYEMSRFFGKKVQIVDIDTIKEMYGDDESEYTNYRDGSRVNPDDLLITVVSADENFPNTDRWYWSYRCLFSPKLMKPSYSPRRINKSIDESIDIKLLPKVAPILTLSQQQEQYKIGDIVLIRPDAFDYFTDTNEAMKKLLGKEGRIEYIDTVEQVYDNEHTTRCKESEPNDLILHVEIEDSNEMYYWYYRCLVNSKFFIPSYKPRKIDKSILENIEYNFRNDYHISPIKYQEKFNRISPTIIPIDDIEEYYDIKFENYVNDLYPELNEDIAQDKQELVKNKLRAGKYDCLLFSIKDDQVSEVREYLDKLSIIKLDRFHDGRDFVLLTKKADQLEEFELYTYSNTNITDIRTHMKTHWSMLENISPIWTFDEFKMYINRTLIGSAKDMYAPKKIDRFS